MRRSERGDGAVAFEPVKIFRSATTSYTCLDCGHQWNVPKRLGRKAQKWRRGGYGYANAHASGIRAFSSAYQGYLSDMKNQRNNEHTADLTLASAAATCPNCASIRHTIG